jgi:two-component system chemotaxis response regulator CheB
MSLRVLVVDDSALYRKVVSEILRELPDVEVVATAVDGQIALQKIEELRPDLVTLDVEMPQLTGVEVLRHLRERGSETGVIMLSAFTSSSAAATTEALRLGAFDFVLKPTGTDMVESRQQLARRLGDRVAAYMQRSPQTPRIDAPKPRVETHRAPEPAERFCIDHSAEREPPEIIVLGISTGGPEALSRVIPALPKDLTAPLFIVQHMPPLFTKSLADDLNRRSALHVYEATDGQLAQPGDCLIAPGGKQMKIEQSPEGPIVHLTDDPPERSCRPSVDYLFRSAAHEYGGRVLAIVMTGMGNDGALGCRLLKRRGATVLIQDQATSVVFGMPGAVFQDGLADEVLPLADIASRIAVLAREGARA